VLLKMGTYGFVRFSLPMFPQAVLTPWVTGVMVTLAIIGIVYGAMVTLVQKDMKKLIAYSSVSHLGFVMLGVFALNMAGIQGAVLQMINHGISTGALFLLVGILYERRHTRLIAEYGGLATQMPVYATYFMVMVLSSMGLPLLNGFIGEFSILQGAFAKSFWWALWAGTGIILGAAYLLWLYQRLFFGELKNPANANLKDLTVREQLTLVPLVVLAFWIGLYPRPIFDVLRLPSEKIVAAVGGATTAAPAMASRAEQPAAPAAAASGETNR
jgi:NADH-quinone oxidoreductase subunit M